MLILLVIFLSALFLLFLVVCVYTFSIYVLDRHCKELDESENKELNSEFTKN